MSLELENNGLEGTLPPGKKHDLCSMQLLYLSRLACSKAMVVRMAHFIRMAQTQGILCA